MGRGIGVRVSRRKMSHPSRRERKPKPLTTQQAEEQREFDERVSEIKERVREAEARGSKGISPYGLAPNVFKREVYRLVRDLRDTKGGLHQIDSAVAQHCKQRPRSWTLDENPFFWALRAISGNPRGKHMNSYVITRLSQQMYYADQHNVAPDIVIGFILQTGLANIKRNMTKRLMEEWYVNAGRQNKAF
jgi:hypothetical protein